MVDRCETFARFNFNRNRGSSMEFKGRRKSKERHGFLQPINRDAPTNFIIRNLATIPDTIWYLILI